MGIFDRSSGKPDVRKLERLADVPALLEALSHGAVQDDATWRLRASAAAALGRLGRPETLGPVRETRQQAQAFAADLRSPDREMLSQFQKAEADLLAAQSRSAGTAGPAVATAPVAPSRPPFNWVTPLFFNTFFAVVLFLWPTNSYGSNRWVQEMVYSLCSALFVPFGFVWLISLVFYLRKGALPAWWRPWQPRIYALAAVLLVGGMVVRGLLTNPANDAYFNGRNFLKDKQYAAAVYQFNTLLQDYPNSAHTAEVRRLLPTIYTDEVKALSGQGQYLEALLQLKNLRKLGTAEATQAGQLTPAVLTALAQDTGDDGQAYLKAVADRACNLPASGTKPDDPCLTDDYGSCSPSRSASQPTDLDLRLSDVQLPAAPGAPARAMTCQAGVPQLPPELAASRPAELRAVIAAQVTNEADGSCSYSFTGDSSGGVSGVVTTHRVHYALQVLDSQTGAVLATHNFVGDTPTCPDTYKFQSGGVNMATGDVYGSPPAESDVTAWLASAVK